MPFVKDIKEEIKNALGVTPEEFKEMQTRLSKLDDIEKKFGDISSLVQTQATGIDEIKSAVGKLAEVKSAYSDDNGGGGGTGTVDGTKSLTEWGVDAEQAFKERTTPIVMGVLSTQADLARRSVQEEMQAANHDWHLFAKEIDDMASKNPVNMKANPEFWRNVYHIIKGRHADEIATDRSNKSGKFFVENATSSIQVKEEDNRKPEDKLTDKEVAYAKNMGVPLEQYAKYKEEQRVF